MEDIGREDEVMSIESFIFLRGEILCSILRTSLLEEHKYSPEISDAEAETPVFCYIWCKKLTHWKKVPDAGKAWGQKEKRASEDEMAGWHRWCSGQELERTAGDGEGQGGLEWGVEELDVTGQLNNNWDNTGTDAENTGWEMNLPG